MLTQREKENIIHNRNTEWAWSGYSKQLCASVFQELRAFYSFAFLFALPFLFHRLLCARQNRIFLSPSAPLSLSRSSPSLYENWNIFSVLRVCNNNNNNHYYELWAKEKVKYYTVHQCFAAIENDCWQDHKQSLSNWKNKNDFRLFCSNFLRSSTSAIASFSNFRFTVTSLTFHAHCMRTIFIHRFVSLKNFTTSYWLN